MSSTPNSQFVGIVGHIESKKDTVDENAEQENFPPQVSVEVQTDESTMSPDFTAEIEKLRQQILKKNDLISGMKAGFQNYGENMRVLQDRILELTQKNKEAWKIYNDEGEEFERLMNDEIGKRGALQSEVKELKSRISSLESQNADNEVKVNNLELINSELRNTNGLLTRNVHHYENIFGAALGALCNGMRKPGLVVSPEMVKTLKSIGCEVDAFNYEVEPGYRGISTMNFPEGEREISTSSDLEFEGDALPVGSTLKSEVGMKINVACVSACSKQLASIPRVVLSADEVEAWKKEVNLMDIIEPVEPSVEDITTPVPGNVPTFSDGNISDCSITTVAINRPIRGKNSEVVPSEPELSVNEDLAKKTVDLDSCEKQMVTDPSNQSTSSGTGKEPKSTSSTSVESGGVTPKRKHVASKSLAKKKYQSDEFVVEIIPQMNPVDGGETDETLQSASTVNRSHSHQSTRTRTRKIVNYKDDDDVESGRAKRPKKSPVKRQYTRKAAVTSPPKDFLYNMGRVISEFNGKWPCRICGPKINAISSQYHLKRHLCNVHKVHYINSKNLCITCKHAKEDLSGDFFTRCEYSGEELEHALAEWERKNPTGNEQLMKLAPKA